jgi:hypothetical protein
VLLYNTEPRNLDSDGDGVRDSLEVVAESDPLDAQSLPTAVLYGGHQLRNALLGINADTGQATVIGDMSGDVDATGARSRLHTLAWSLDGHTLYALGTVTAQNSVQNRLHTLDPDTAAVRSTVMVTAPHPDSPTPPVLTALGVDANGALLATVSSIDDISELGRLDPATGELTLLGLTGFRRLFGLQFDADFRTLYAITANQVPPVLVSLDPVTGQGTAIAETDLPTQAEAMAFTADRRLVVAGRDGNLYELDPVTGASTLIGPTGVGSVNGMSLRVWR